MKKTLLLGCICFILSTSLFSGCVNVPKELTQMSFYTFSAVPNLITQGQTANLSWSVIGATTVSIDQSIGSVSLVGTRIIAPAQSTTYTLTASNTIKTITATVQILVYPYYSPPNQTPNVACTTDSTTNRIQVATADANIKWSDIVITTDPGATWQVFSSNGYPLAQTGNTAAITADVAAGDYILISGTTGNVRVTLKYTPTNSLLGSWTINV